MKSAILFHVNCPRNFFQLCGLYLTGILKPTQSPFPSIVRTYQTDFYLNTELAGMLPSNLILQRMLTGEKRF